MVIARELGCCPRRIGIGLYGTTDLLYFSSVGTLPSLNKYNSGPFAGDCLGGYIQGLIANQIINIL
jgi:hypothetical protein